MRKLEGKVAAFTGGSNGMALATVNSPKRVIDRSEITA
jgi:hypothetical protein